MRIGARSDGRRSPLRPRSRRTRSRSCCATWARSMSAGGCIEVNGQPIKEVVFTPGGVPAKVDPNGDYQVEQMYAQYFLPQNRKGKLPLLLWHGGGLTGVTYETKPDGGEGWLNYFLRKGWDTYVSDAMERGRSGWTDKFKGEPVFLPLGDPWERFRIGPSRLMERRPGQARDLSGHAVPARGLRAVHEAGRAALGHDRRADRRGLYRAGRQGLPVRRAGAQPGRHVRLQGRGGAARQGEGAGRGRADGSAATRTRSRRSRTSPMLMMYGDNAKEHPRWGKIRQNGVDYAGRCSRRPAARVDLIDLPDIGIKGNCAHDDDGQEQRSGRRGDPEMAGGKGFGAH